MMSPARAKTRPFSTKRSRAYSSLINAAILTLVVISGVEAALPPQVYEKARADATYHVQVKTSRVIPPARTSGDCETEGEVVRIFRDKSGARARGSRSR